MNKNTDTTFFTNDESGTLLDRFKSTLKDVEKFDVLVGYFRTSGFYHLYKELESVDKIRILNGIDVDSKTVEIIQEVENELPLSSLKLKENFSDHIQKEVANSDDKKEIYEGYLKFKEYLKSGKIEFRQHPDRNIHAKVYISRFKEDDRDFGRVITGSSNFSHSGLKAQHEFNVELKDRGDVETALEHFENLWADGVDISQEYINTLDNKTWINDAITPYELYLKMLYEYFFERINLDKETSFVLPDGYFNLEYQKEAVNATVQILNEYNGAFLADVVGLGKTYIAALIARQFRSSWKIIICPPVLKDYWEETFLDFGLSRFKVFSGGNLTAIKEWSRIDDVEYVFVDEAHRFRNEDTETFKDLHDICFGKKVLLITATPLNNKPTDILSQLKLIFDFPKRSPIPNVPNLQSFFMRIQNSLKKIKDSPVEYGKLIKSTSKEIREKVLQHVMVRRTRSEIMTYFSEDIKKQNLFFPEVQDPRRFIYKFDSKTAEVFNETLRLIKDEFKKTRYMPLKYIKTTQGFELQRQENLGGFMKTILVKRLESSFYAFRKSINRFIDSHENFIRMFNQGRVLISKTVDVYDLLEDDNIEEKVELYKKEEKLQDFKSEDFNNKFIEDLKHDLQVLIDIKNIWRDIRTDPKLKSLEQSLGKDPDLKDKKIVIFSESKETTDYLLDHLQKEHGSKLMIYGSGGGYRYIEGKKTYIDSKTSMKLIRANFDPNIKEENQLDNINIIITTDVLAEGINLHRSNVLLNYDLPWNPTRVIQRVGRVNRINTKFSKIYIYNFFPTEESDEVINMEINIQSKIQAFHDCLGEDAKYLSDNEDIEQYALFGDQLYNQLNKKDSYLDEDEEQIESSLKYLKVIRNVRDNDLKLYEIIKNLPPKARTSRLFKEQKNALISFFRKGKLKKFIYNDLENPSELIFLDAAKYFECESDEKREKIPNNFFEIVQNSKVFFDQLFEAEIDQSDGTKGVSNEKKLIGILTSNLFKNHPHLEDHHREMRLKLIRALDNGSIMRKTIKNILVELGKEEINPDEKPIEALRIFSSHISPKFLESIAISGKTINRKKEIILSEYLK
jgi:superfamily II DNA/RNA helicase/HKD family nuclease